MRLASDKCMAYQLARNLRKRFGGCELVNAVETSAKFLLENDPRYYDMWVNTVPGNHKYRIPAASVFLQYTPMGEDAPQYNALYLGVYRDEVAAAGEDYEPISFEDGAVAESSINWTVWHLDHLGNAVQIIDITANIFFIKGEETVRVQLLKFKAGVRSDESSVLEGEVAAQALKVFQPAVVAAGLIGCGRFDSTPRTQAKKAAHKARSTKDYFTYKVLTLTGEYANYVPRGGTHASPRLHERRGHVRHLKNGRTTWVKHCLVGDASLGVVDKEYIYKPKGLHQ